MPRRRRPRAWGNASPLYQLHDKKVYSADYSPSRPWLLATSSIDRTVCLWDVRALSASKKPKPLHALDHGLAVTAARFSPAGTKLLTTCNDNLLRVYESADASWAGKGLASARAAVKHNNHTGRYITPFQAEWLRGDDSVFLCGSLAQPRGLDVFSCEEGGGADFRLDEEEAVSSVLSLVAQHPSRSVLVASNSGGKCFVWR